MKKLFVLFMLVTSAFVSAQTVTIVMVTPQRPVDCRTADYSMVNWVYQVKTISEDSDEAKVQFITQFGQCVDGKTVPNTINVEQAAAYALQNGFLWPWQKDGVKTTLSAYSDTEVLVSMTLNKRILFKKRPENHLSFYFQPGMTFPARMVTGNNGQMYLWAPKVQFPWNVDLYLDGDIDGNNSVRLMIR